MHGRLDGGENLNSCTNCNSDSVHLLTIEGEKKIKLKRSPVKASEYCV